MRACFLVLALSLAACSPPTTTPRTGTVPDLDARFAFDSLIVINDRGDELKFDIYLATDFEQHRRGLMFVRGMPERTGMLFIYEREEIRSMWMKNTYIPLDLVFARADGSVINVITDTVPQTLNSHRSAEPSLYVLELNAGTARRLGIGNASRIVWDD